MGDNNIDLSTRNTISNGRVMCFVFVSIMITNNIYNNFTRPRYDVANVGLRCFDAAPFANSCDASGSRDAQFEYLCII